MLEHLQEAGGASVILYNAPPRREFVLYLADANFDTEELDKVAGKRHEPIKKGVIEKHLAL